MKLLRPEQALNKPHLDLRRVHGHAFELDCLRRGSALDAGAGKVDCNELGGLERQFLGMSGHTYLI